MRTLLLASLASAAVLLSACSKSNVDPTASGEVTSAAAMQQAIGGQLVAVGENKVEVRVFADGHVEALVLDARGKAISDPQKAKVTVRAMAKGTPSSRTAIDLAWDPVIARFAGKAAGKVDLEAAPIDVDLKIGEASASGKLDAPVLLVGPEIGGTLFVAGKYGVELSPRVDGSVEAIVRNAAGVKVDGDAKTKIEVNLAANAGATTKVALAWDAPSARFLGKADASAKLTGGPAEISIDGAVVAKLPRVAVRAEASHGGRVVVAGDYSVELVAKGDVVNAFVFDASGAAVAKADLDLSMRLGNGAFVKLVWDAPSLAYRADIDGKIDFAMQPIVVAIKGDAKAHVGASLPSLDAKANAKVDAKAEAKADAKLDGKADVKIDPKAKLDAKAKVNAPKVEVKPVSVSKNASASAGNGAANAKAGFSLGTK
jgi:hypothetical protein